MEPIKVSSSTRSLAAAGAIAGVVREHHRAEVIAIGAAAVNQAVKAIILAKSFLEGDGIFIALVAEFVDITFEDKVRTAIKFTVEPKPESRP